MSAIAVNLDKGLPASLDAERLVLGCLLLDFPAYVGVMATLRSEDFSFESHRRIFTAIRELDTVGAKVDRVTVYGKLADKKLAESVGGLSYLVSLDDGLPQLSNLDGYIDIVREKAALRRIVFASRSLMNRALSSEEKAHDIAGSFQRTLEQIDYQSQAEDSELLNPSEVIDRAGGLDKFLRPRSAAGAETPWRRLNDLNNGYRRGELVVLAGNPSHGKSSAAMQIAAFLAERKHGVVVFSLEMPRQSLLHRVGCMKARVDQHRFRMGYLNADERDRIRQAMNALSTWPLWIAEHGASTTQAVKALLRKKRSESDVLMVVIDYLQLMQGIGRFQNRNAEITEISRSLKLLAKEENVVVLLLSQLTRENVREGRAPALYDLRESGAIEQDADEVIFVWRPELLPKHRDREDLRGTAELILAKQRSGPIGKVELVWIGAFTKFESRAEDVDAN